MNNIKLVIFDLDGTLYFKNKIIAGANEVIKKLDKKGIKTVFMTNTDAKTVNEIYEKVTRIGLNIDENQIFNPIVAIKSFLNSEKGKKVYALVSDSVLKEFHNINLAEKDVDYVVIGDFSKKVTYENINKTFKMIVDGAEILATQKAKFYYDETGKNIDTGSFVNMFEYATGKRSKVFGKPNEEYFNTIIKSFGILDNKQVVVVGDDVNTDIKGAKQIGAQGVLVKTGKYHDNKNNNIKADYVIETVKDLPNIIL